jgi:hypothetical protein
MNDQSPGAVLLNNDLRAAIRTIPDFPKPGIMFRDITTLIKDPILLRRAVDVLAEHYRDARIEMVIAVESRGFILGAPLAYKLGAGFVPHARSIRWNTALTPSRFTGMPSPPARAFSCTTTCLPREAPSWRRQNSWSFSEETLRASHSWWSSRS